MVSCVLPSRGAWPLDRQMPGGKGLGEAWRAGEEDPGVGREGPHPKLPGALPGPKAEILIDFINLSPINLGRHMRAAACLPGPGPPTLATRMTPKPPSTCWGVISDLCPASCPARYL